jgi:hypothetical protein
MRLITALLALFIVTAAPFTFVHAEEKPAGAAGGDEYEKALVTVITELEKLGILFAGVKDEATAKAAQPHIANAITAIDAARAKSASVAKPANEAALTSKHAARLQAAVGKLATESSRIKANPAAGTILADSLAKALKK